MTDAERAEIVAAAEARADADCERGLRDLAARLRKVKPWVISGDANGRRLVLPEGDSTRGMHAHLAASMETERARRAAK